MVAVNSDNYCQGADRAITLVASEFVAIGALEGGTFLFQVLGNILIPGLGGYATYLLVTHLEQFNTPSSVDYIAQPEIIAAVGAAICLGVSLSFMSIFDTVSDAMLFAFMTDEEWRERSQNAIQPQHTCELEGTSRSSQGVDSVDCLTRFAKVSGQSHPRKDGRLMLNVALSSPWSASFRAKAQL